MTTAVKTLAKPTGPVVPHVRKTTRKEASRRTHAKPIKFIRDINTREVVGWLYQWNTGALVPMWKDGQRTGVIYD